MRQRWPGFLSWFLVWFGFVFFLTVDVYSYGTLCGTAEMWGGTATAAGRFGKPGRGARSHGAVPASDQDADPGGMQHLAMRWRGQRLGLRACAWGKGGVTGMKGSIIRSQKI